MRSATNESFGVPGATPASPPAPSSESESSQSSISSWSAIAPVRTCGRARGVSGYPWRLFLNSLADGKVRLVPRPVPGCQVEGNRVAPASTRYHVAEAKTARRDVNEWASIVINDESSWLGVEAFTGATRPGRLASAAAARFCDTPACR